VNLQPSDQPIEPGQDSEPASDDFLGWFQRGLKFAQLGFPDRAAESFEQAQHIEPEDATLQFNLGTAYLSLGNFVQAVTNLDRAISLDPSNSDAYGNRAVAHAALGQEELVEADVKIAISLGAPLEGIESVLAYVRERVNPDQD
jgi:tetratricopeptide (TPR) repeat protein|tara:strand:- start:1187 stop:1618 length:432 start_codon:yes stop_codon:yes gene_type:complete